MNKCKLCFVLLAGLAFAFVLVALRKSLESLAEDIGDATTYKSAVSPISLKHLGLMDSGYLSLSTIRANNGDTALSTRTPSELEGKNNLLEAGNCLKVGKRLMESGRFEKAGKLFERAVALAPSFTEALIVFGEYLEHHKYDIKRADQLYVRALMIAPTNKRAIRNRLRTKEIVAIQDLRMLEQVDLKRLQLNQVPDSFPALKRIQREAYFYHVHHTVAIEGNTMTLEEIRTVLETGLSIGGKSVAEHTEVVGVDSALRYINNTLLHRVGRITLQDILDIHLRVLGHTDPPVAGHLRSTQVFVGAHIPPPPARLQDLMEQFVQWLNHPTTVSLHPVRYAALAHYHLVYIHPFMDGNGRTARLLMNFLLMQAGYPPVIIRHQDRLQYYDSLQAANEGDTRPFVRFISYCTERTLDVYLWATKDAFPGIEQERHALSNRYYDDFSNAGIENAAAASPDLSKDGIPLIPIRNDKSANGASTWLKEPSDELIGNCLPALCDVPSRSNYQAYGQRALDPGGFIPKIELEPATVFPARWDESKQDLNSQSKSRMVLDDSQQYKLHAEKKSFLRPVPSHLDDMGLLFTSESFESPAHHWLQGRRRGAADGNFFRNFFSEPNFADEEDIDLMDITNEDFRNYLPDDGRGL